MDPDLQDLLIAWTGHEVEASRRAALAEVRLLGQLKAGQSAGPRWLALEDELASGVTEPAEVPLEDRVFNQLPAPRRRSRRTAALAAGLLIEGLSCTPCGPAATPSAPPRDPTRPRTSPCW